MSQRARKPEQYHYDELGESQMSACFQRATWSVTKIGRDYGQDFLLHPFKDGDLTGHDGYIQLKSTNDVSKHAHSTRGFRYQVTCVHLRQWYRYVWPVFVILWDTTREQGY